MKYYVIISKFNYEWEHTVIMCEDYALALKLVSTEMYDFKERELVEYNKAVALCGKENVENALTLYTYDSEYGFMCYDKNNDIVCIS